MQFVNKIIKQNIKAVTLLELIIAIAILSIGLAAIIKMVSGWNHTVDRLRQSVVAINLSREWMEQVYNIRNTNRLRRWWKKDACRLKIDPLSDWGNGLCQDDDRMTKWHYIIIPKIKDWQRYYALSWSFMSWLDMSYFDVGVDDKYSMCYTWWYWEPCPGEMFTRSEWRFFREIGWKWLYRKDVNITGWTFISCVNWEDAWCADKRAKEYRFCSKVEFVKQYNWSVEMCWVLTNFEK